jgi:hypothetical protein
LEALLQRVPAALFFRGDEAAFPAVLIASAMSPRPLQ